MKLLKTILGYYPEIYLALATITANVFASVAENPATLFILGGIFAGLTILSGLIRLALKIFGK